MNVCPEAPGEAVGIAVIGLNGAGKSTLAHQLAKKLGLFEIDAEDYFFPAQKASRMADLDGTAPEKSALPDGEIPFLSGRSGDEAWRAIADDVTTHPRFVISSVTIKSAEVISRLTAAVMLRAPLDTRLSRIAARERRRFRDRVLPGGDMYESQSEFHRFVSGRSEDMIAENAAKFGCPVLCLDGTAPLTDNIRAAAEFAAASAKKRI